MVTDSPERSDGEVPIRIGLTARKRHNFSSGLGYATDFGPRLSLTYDNRYLTRSMHQFSSHLVASSLLREIGGEYRLPIMPRGDPWLGINGRWSQEETNSYDTTNYSVGLRHLTNGLFGFRATEFLAMRFEDFRVGEERRDVFLVEPQLQLNRSRELQPGPLATGWSIEVVVRGAFKPLSSTTFAQGLVKLEGALRLSERYRLLGRSRLGATMAEELDALPPDRRFFIGGDNSVSGYGYQAEGPRDARGLVIGGRNLTEFSIELERLMGESWSLATFIDTGSAWDDQVDQWFTGVGFGVRLHTPIGPIRADLAFPLDDSRSVRVHFGIGTRFK